MRKVSAAGVITRVAGTGTLGNAGDDGPATDARLNVPVGVAVTADGGFLVADAGNHEVRKVSGGGGDHSPPRSALSLGASPALGGIVGSR